jgi:hypothetical protein
MCCPDHTHTHQLPLIAANSNTGLTLLRDAASTAQAALKEIDTRSSMAGEQEFGRDKAISMYCSSIQSIN